MVRYYILSIKSGKASLQNQVNIEKVERKNLITLLYKDIKKVKSMTKEQLEKVIQIYSELKIIYKIIKQFKEILFSKDNSKLERWLKETRTLTISELSSFISGIERDLEAVKNAITHKYSNGLPERTVNKSY